MKTFIKEKLFNKKGFTLVEIILIFGTLGILTAVIIPSLPDYKKTDETNYVMKIVNRWKKVMRSF